VTEIGTAIVSYIEPHVGQDAAFDHWYGTDHFPSAVLAGPGVISGMRFRADAEYKAFRGPSATLFGDPRRGTYLAVAWLRSGMQAAWDAWIVETMKELTAQGRLFEGRDHVHTAVYRCEGTEGDPTRGTFGGVIAVADANSTPKLSLAPSATLQLERTVMSSADPPPHALVLAFCASDPITAFREADLPGDYGFASPFLTLRSSS
jgi:hypothetical protein